MTWSVRTCTECGEYRYVEDGVCRDCQDDEMVGYGFKELQGEIESEGVDLPVQPSIEEPEQLLEKDEDFVVRWMRRKMGLGRMPKEYHLSQMIHRLRHQINNDVNEAKRLLSVGYVVEDRLDGELFEVIETHPQKEYFVGKSLERGHSMRFAYDVFTRGQFELVGKEDDSTVIDEEVDVDADELVEELENGGDDGQDSVDTAGDSSC